MRLLEKHRSFREMILAGSPALVDISDAARWYFVESPQDVWNMAEDMNSLTPPDEHTYMEFCMPERINVNGEMIEYEAPRLSVGCMIQCREIDEGVRSIAQRNWLLEEQFSSIIGTDFDRMLMSFSEDDEWSRQRANGISLGISPSFLLRANVVIDEGNSLRSVLGILMYLDERGKAYPAGNGTMLSPNIYDHDIKDENYIPWFTPFAFALSLMNCKNVHLIDDQRRLVRNQRRKMERDGNPVVDYKWLHIKQLQKRADADTAHQPTGRRNRLHFVRAHWATYTADAPLFGKYQGVFFKPSHVKGSLSAGVALKDYAVDAPTED